MYETDTNNGNVEYKLIEFVKPGLRYPRTYKYVGGI